MHSHQWSATLYFLTWSDFIRYDPEGNVLVDSRTMPRKPQAGEALWAGPLPPHYVHNIGEGELRVIAVEVKG